MLQVPILSSRQVLRLCEIKNCRQLLLTGLRWKHSNKKIDRGQNPEVLEEMPIYEFTTLKTSQKKHRSTVFSWGFSGTGALGNENHLKRQVGRDGSLEMPKTMIKRAPQRLRFVTPETTVYDVAAGSGFTVFAATVHKTPYVLFGCGLNTDSQIGYQETVQHEPLVCVANVVPIRVPIEAGKNEISTKGSPKEKMIKVAAGRAHTFCLTNSGQGKMINQSQMPIVTLSAKFSIFTWK